MKITERVQYYLQEASLEIKGILKDSGTKIKKINSNIHRFCSTKFEKLTAKILELIVDLKLFFNGKTADQMTAYKAKSELKNKKIEIAETQFKNDPNKNVIIRKIEDQFK